MRNNPLLCLLGDCGKGFYWEVVFNLPSSSTTCSNTDEGTVSSSSSDRSLLSPSFHVNSCSANAMARGNSSGKECSTKTAPGGGDTPTIKTTGYLITFYLVTHYFSGKVEAACMNFLLGVRYSPSLMCTLSVGMITEGYWLVVGGGVRPVLVGEASSG